MLSNCWRTIMTQSWVLIIIWPPQCPHHTPGTRTPTFSMTSPGPHPEKRWLNSGKFNWSVMVSSYLKFNFQYWRGTRGRRVAKVPSTDKIISRNKKFGRGSEEQKARDPGRASAHVNNQDEIAESDPGQGDCGPDCQNLLHELGHPQEAARCPQGQVIDIWGYCRFVMIIFVSRPLSFVPLVTQSVDCWFLSPSIQFNPLPQLELVTRSGDIPGIIKYPDSNQNCQIIMIISLANVIKIPSAKNSAVQCHSQSQRLMDQESEIAMEWSKIQEPLN